MSLHPDYPVVQGQLTLGQNWSITLPSPFNRRIEDDDLVLWQPGITAWLAIWNNEAGLGQQERLAWVKSKQSAQAQASKETQRGTVLYYQYRLDEIDHSDDEDGLADAGTANPPAIGTQLIPALYCFAFGTQSQLEIAFYCDDEAQLAIAESMFLSLNYR